MQSDMMKVARFLEFMKKREARSKTCGLEMEWHTLDLILGAICLALRHPDIDAKTRSSLNDAVRQIVAGMTGGDRSETEWLLANVYDTTPRPFTDN